jgi:hypothetical protein
MGSKIVIQSCFELKSRTHDKIKPETKLKRLSNQKPAQLMAV